MTIRTLGVIPARGDSKGIPRKNLRDVAGEPLIGHAIRAAQASLLLTTFLTTTDDAEIAEVAQRLGSPVLRRPAELASDDASVISVLLHAVEHAEQKSGVPYPIILLLQPTSPMRTGGDIDAVIEMLAEDPTLESVISVCRVEDSHPARMYRFDAEGLMVPVWPEWETARRQEMPVVYHRNGALYACRRDVLMERHTIMGEKKRAYVMPRDCCANIDDEVDILFADLLMRRWKRSTHECSHPKC